MPRWSWGPPAGNDPRRTSDEARQNTPAIIAALVEARTQHPRTDATLALELGSGSGEHVLALAERFPELTWQPSDPDPVQRASVVAWAETSPARVRIRPPLDLDASIEPWGLEAGSLALVLAIHVLHIAPAAAVTTLARESARLLAPHGLLVVHDSFLDDAGAHPSARMREFDRTLRARDPRAGLRGRAELERAAREVGLVPVIALPYADQVTWVFAKPAPSP